MKSLLYSLTQISISQIFGIVIVSLLLAQVIVSIAYCFKQFIDRHLITMSTLLIALIALIFGVSITTIKSHNAQDVINYNSYSLTRDHDTLKLTINSSYFPKTTELKIVSENDSTIQVNYENKTFSIDREELKK